MKIAIITETFPKLSETFVINHVKGLLDAGIEVRIFAFYGFQDDRHHEIVDQYRLLELVTYKTEEPLQKLPRIKKGLALFFKNVFKYPKAVLSAVNFFKYGSEALRLHRLFEVCTFLGNETFDIIHCHFGTTAEKVALYMQWGVLQGPMFASFHGYEFEEYNVRRNNFYKHLSQAGSRFISNSSFTRKKLLDLGFSERKISVIPAAMDVEFYTRRKLVTMSTKIRIVSIGRLVEFKGMEIGIRAVSEAVKRHNLDIEYTVVGDGPLFGSLNKLVDELNMNAVIRLVGQKSQTQIYELLSSASLFLHTGVRDSSGREENQGVVVQEAQSMEIPVIVSNIGGVSEGMLSNESGFIVPPGNIEEIVSKIHLLCTNPVLREQMGKRGRAFVEKRYSVEETTRQIIQLYRKELEAVGN